MPRCPIAGNATDWIKFVHLRSCIKLYHNTSYMMTLRCIDIYLWCMSLMLWIGADWLSWSRSQEDVVNSVRSTRWCWWRRPNDDAKSSRNTFTNGTTERKLTALWYARHCRRTPTCTTVHCCSVDHSTPTTKIRAHSTFRTIWRYICAICFQVMKFWNKIVTNINASILSFIHVFSSSFD